MKTYRRLYPQVYAFESLYAAYRRARQRQEGQGAITAVRDAPCGSLHWQRVARLNQRSEAAAESINHVRFPLLGLTI